MTILNALTRLYDRLLKASKVPPPGYSREKISFALVIDKQGRPLRLADKRSFSGNAPAPTLISVPAGSRTSEVKPNLLWDKTAYVFGVIAGEQEDEAGAKHVIPTQGPRTAEEHASFIEEHRKLLAEATDSGLIALRLFLDRWKPEMFSQRNFNLEALDSNIVFEFDDEIGSCFIHARAAAKELLERATSSSEAGQGICLVSGERGPIKRLHPKLKGVKGAQSSGASLVSFNCNAYESFGKSQGSNAQVSERAAFAYGAALNALLESDSQHKLRVGDTKVVFWAEAAKPDASRQTEKLMFQTFQPPDDDAEVLKLKAAIADIASGYSACLDLEPTTRVYMLGLAPNAARLSVRFWHQDTLGDFARHIDQFWRDLRIEPTPWKGPPTVRSLLYETAIRANDKPNADTIPPLLGGQLMRSTLTGSPLPRSILSAVITRIRAEGDVNGRRTAICKAVVNRTTKEEKIPVSLDHENTNPAYRLGRLFAVLERAQSSALQGLNATIKDRYFAAASSTPARIFPLLIKNATHHLALLKKGKNQGLGHWLEKELGTIWLGIAPDMPRSLSLEDQGRFIAGYYHQRWTKETSEDVPSPKDTNVETRENKQ